MVRILKSMPMVVMNEGVNESSLKRSRQHDLPTPESPMRSSLIYAGGGELLVSAGLCIQAVEAGGHLRVQRICMYLGRGKLGRRRNKRSMRAKLTRKS